MITVWNVAAMKTAETRDKATDNTDATGHPKYVFFFNVFRSSVIFMVKQTIFLHNNKIVTTFAHKAL